MVSETKTNPGILRREVAIDAGGTALAGNLAIPAGAVGLVLFAHGSGSSRHSPRNQFVAQALNARAIATLLLDLLTAEEERLDVYTAQFRFDIPLLAKRLAGTAEWVRRKGETRDLPLGFFGASTGAAAALIAAADMGEDVAAVVSRGGRPDLAGRALETVEAPTLLIVGSEDEPVIGMNREALARLGSARKEMVLIPGATHLFEEPGTLEEVARIAGDWFAKYLPVSARERRTVGAA